MYKAKKVSFPNNLLISRPISETGYFSLYPSVCVLLFFFSLYHAVLFKTLESPLPGVPKLNLSHSCYCYLTKRPPVALFCLHFIIC